MAIATEGALWGAVVAHGFLSRAVIVSDAAGQFNIGEHALCWVHADLKAYRDAPEPRRKAELKARFDRIFKQRTGFATLDRLLTRLHANKPELLRVLDRPEIPSTPMARKTTSAVRSPAASSAALPGATRAAIVATPSLVWPKHAGSSASPSGITSAPASPCRPSPRWAPHTQQDERPAFCPCYLKTL